MRIQKLKYHFLRKIVITTVILIPIAFGGSYIGVYLGIMVPDLTEYMEIPPDTSEFYNLADINLTRLEEIGTEFEHVQEKHLPINLSQTITLNATTGEIIYYHRTDNGALHTSENLIASCFRYASLSTGPEKDYSLYLIRKMLDGMRLLIEVPNGGLGPEYPGTKIGRFYAPPDKWNDGNYSWIFDDYFRHFNGTGKYSQWRIRLYTSKDELGGYFGSLAAMLSLVDVPDIQNITKLIILQAMEGFLSSFWQEMSGDGKPNGVHFQPPSEAQWKLLLTKMATIVDPDNARYKQLFNYYLTKERRVNRVPFTGKMDNIDNYYSHYFGNMIILGLFLVEDDPKLLDLYFKNFQEKTYPIYRGHRNGFQNALYLAAAAACSSIRPADFDLESIRWDVLDQLWRFADFNLIPFDTRCGGTNQTTSRSSLGAEWLEIDPNIAQWKNFVDNTWFGGLYKWLTYEIQDAVFDTRYLKPATVDMFRPTETIWNKNPYREDGVHIFDTTNNVTQYAGASFTLPYYMLKYFGYLEVP